MALKFFPRQSTSLTSFLREYNLSLSYCTHPSLTRALGIFFSTPTYYVFAQQAGLYGDLYSVIVSEVSSTSVCGVKRAVPSPCVVCQTGHILNRECSCNGFGRTKTNTVC